jgi:hypothetical protein
MLIVLYIYTCREFIEATKDDVDQLCARGVEQATSTAQVIIDQYLRTESKDQVLGHAIFYSTCISQDLELNT